jgi:hypothetical protein
MAEKKVAKKFWETGKALTMARQYEKGKTIKELSEKYGVTMAAISQTLKVLGVATRGRGRRVAE